MVRIRNTFYFYHLISAAKSVKETSQETKENKAPVPRPYGLKFPCNTSEDEETVIMERDEGRACQRDKILRKSR